MTAHPEKPKSRIFIAAATIALALVICTASATTTPTSELQGHPTDPAENAAELVQRAFNDVGHDDAKAETLAARRPEHGSMNVSQLINLADLYADLDEPDKAASVIIELGDMSPFGRMQLESVKLRIAIEKKDSAAIDDAMAYLREHRTDALATWEDALLLRGQLDDAAALLIERLENPAWRNAALVDMQHYAHVAERPMRKTIDQNWDAITGRPDVQAAMQKVGRIGRFDITSALR